MTRTPKPLARQLNLSLMSAEALPVDPEKHHELTLALIELLTTAACPLDDARGPRGGDDESKTHR
jgi:hypothetical protein